MSALARVRAGGRSLDGRLAAVPAEALLAGLRAAGAVSEPEVAALGAPASGGWAGRLRALAVAKGDRTCGVLLSVLRRLEGPPRPGPFDFYDPQRDAAPAHRSDCPCCRPEPEWTRGEEEEGPKIGDEGREEEEEENPKNEEGDEGHEDDEEGDEGHEDDDGGGGDEGHEEEEEEEPENGDEGHEEEEEEEPENGDEGHEDDDDDDGGGDEGPENDAGDDDGGGGDEGPEDDDDDGGGGDED